MNYVCCECIWHTTLGVSECCPDCGSAEMEPLTGLPVSGDEDEEEAYICEVLESHDRQRDAADVRAVLARAEPAPRSQEP